MSSLLDSACLRSNLTARCFSRRAERAGRNVTGRLDGEDAWVSLFPDGVTGPAQQSSVILFTLDSVSDVTLPARTGHGAVGHFARLHRRVEHPAEGEIA